MKKIDFTLKDLQPGDAILVFGEGIISNLIQLEPSAQKLPEGKRSSHVACYVGGGKNYIVEMGPEGTSKNTMQNYYKKNDFCVARLKRGLLVKEAETLKAFWYNRVGKHAYQFSALFEIAICTFASWIGINLWNKRAVFKDDRQYICSELYCSAYESIGENLVPDKASEKKTPADIQLSKKMQVIAYFDRRGDAYLEK